MEYGWKACNRQNRFPSSNLGRSADKWNPVGNLLSGFSYMGMYLVVGILIVGFCYYKVGGMVKNLCKQNKNLTFAEINKLQWKRILI